jgi:disulfide bond formation protein DsbB
VLSDLNPVRAAQFVFITSLAIIVGAWLFQFAGYLPCDLCYMQRWAYYAVVPLTLLLALLKPTFIRAGLWLAGLIMAGSMVFGIYHSGVEWGWWEGPTTCGDGELTGLLPDLNAPVVKCNEAAIRILGLSLAGWNAIASAVIAAIAVTGARHGSSSASQ